MKLTLRLLPVFLVCILSLMTIGCGGSAGSGEAVEGDADPNAPVESEEEEDVEPQ